MESANQMRMDIKQRIISELKTIKIPNLLSLSIIGSFIHKEKLSAIEDVDIYLILRELDKGTYEAVKDAFEKIVQKLSAKNVKFIVELRAGAFKPKFEKGKKTLQLHIIINTPESIAKKSPMVSLDWRLNNFPVSGQDVSNFLKVNKFSKNELVSGRDGLRYFLDLLKAGKKAYLEWIVRDDLVERVKKEVSLKSDEDWFELIQFVVIQGFTNFIRLDEPTFPKQKSRIIEKATRVLPQDKKDFLKEVLSLKSKFTNTGKLDCDVSRLKSKASSFLESLIDLLEK